MRSSEPACQRGRGSCEKLYEFKTRRVVDSSFILRLLGGELMQIYKSIIMGMLAVVWSMTAHAQDIIAKDQDSSAGGKISNFFAPTPVSPTIAAPVQAPATSPAPSLPKPNTPSSALMTPVPTTGTPPIVIPVRYLPPNQQQALIQQEQTHIARLQTVLARLNNNLNTVNRMPKSNSTNSTNGSASTSEIQQGVQNSINRLSKRLQTSQQRLQLLQAGPLPVNDMSLLYQHQ